MHKVSPTENIAAIIVHLSRNLGRADNTKALIAALPVNTSVLEATDSNKLTDVEQQAYSTITSLQPRYPFPLNRGEIACFLSHRRAWQSIIDNGLKGALILEDGISVDIPKLKIDLDIVSANGYDIVRCPDITRRRPRVIETIVSNDANSIQIARPELIGIGMQLTYVSEPTAEILLTKTERFDRPVDTYLQLRFDHQLDVLCCDGVAVEDISKHLGGSEVGTKKKPNALAKLNKEICRPIYKWQLQKKNYKYQLDINLAD